MKCSKCDTEYDESFKFCPNCAEANPLVKKEEPVIVEPPVPPIEESSVIPAQPPEPPKPKKKLSESIKPIFAKISIKPIFAKIKEKTNKKTIIIGASILVLVIAVIVVAVVLTRPTYPDTIKLGSYKSGGLSIKGLTLTKREKEVGLSPYELTGTAIGSWNGNAVINLSITTDAGSSAYQGDLTIKRNEEQRIKSSVTSDPIQKCEYGVTYDGKMNADDFVSIDNVVTGQTLTVGNSVIVGTIKEDGSTVTFNGQPVQIGADKKFSITTNINEGLNTVNFEVTEKEGNKSTKTITLTGQISPEVYKASCPAGPPFANLNKNPDSFKGTPVHYRGQVAQAMESGGETNLRVDITSSGYGFWTDTIYVTISGPTPAVEKSIVDIYGTVGGSYTYTSTANYKITLPLINAKYVDVVQ